MHFFQATGAYLNTHISFHSCTNSPAGRYYHPVLHLKKIKWLREVNFLEPHGQRVLSDNEGKQNKFLKIILKLTHSELLGVLLKQGWNPVHALPSSPDAQLGWPRHRISPGPLPLCNFHGAE